MIKTERGEGNLLAEAVGEIGNYYRGRQFVRRPVFETQLDHILRYGAGEFHLSRIGKKLLAVLFHDRGQRCLMPIFLTEDLQRQREILSRRLARGKNNVLAVNRPPWDLRVGTRQLALYRSFGFAAGSREVLFRLSRDDYEAGYDLREEIDGAIVEYRCHQQEMQQAVETLTPLLSAWSGFFTLEGHNNKTCRLFTASVDGIKMAVLWVLFPVQCRQDQNDCYLYWKREMGTQSIFVRSTVTEDRFRSQGLGSSLHRFMLAHYFKGREPKDDSYISTNAENRANVGLLQGLGYRRVRVCRYHNFLRR